FGVQVQAPHRLPFALRQLGQLAKYRGAVARIVIGDDFAHRLVIGDHPCRGRCDAETDGLAVDLDLVAELDALTDVGRFVVDGNPAFGDELLHLETRTQARLRQQLVQFGGIRLRREHPLGGRYLGTFHFGIELAGNHVGEADRNRRLGLGLWLLQALAVLTLIIGVGFAFAITVVPELFGHAGFGSLRCDDALGGGRSFFFVHLFGGLHGNRATQWFVHVHVSTACAASSAAPSWAGCWLLAVAAAAGSGPPGSARLSIARSGWSAVPNESNTCACCAGLSSTGNWSRESKPRSSRNWRVVANRAGRPTVSRWPMTSTQPRSSSCFRINALMVTPRMSSMSPRVHGWRYAMMASVSSTARVYLGGFSGCSRSRYSRISGRLWKRQPLATWTSSTPRWVHSFCRSASSALIVSAPSSSLNSTRNSRNGNGCCEQIKAVSRTRFASVVFMVLPIREKAPSGAQIKGRFRFAATQATRGCARHATAGRAGSATLAEGVAF